MINSTIQVSGFNSLGEPVLSVFAKESYVVDNEFKKILFDKSESLTEEPVLYDSHSNSLKEDTDIFPFKPLTDVVIKGYIYGYENRRRITTVASINGYEKRMRAIGDRQCKLDHQTNILFSKPKIITKIPLSYLSAYGGRDEYLYEQHGSVLQDVFDAEMLDNTEDLSMSNPFIYPRNPCGKGYLLEKNKESVASLQLPNIEDPKHLLTPETLTVGDRLNWHKMPLPQATDWVNYSWFPRVALLGFIPPFYKREHDTLIEIERGFLPSSILDTDTVNTSLAVTCGASLGLQVPYLKGGEPIMLTHMHPEYSEWKFYLPANAPKIWTDGRNGKLTETCPVIHTLTIQPDENKITIVWRGSAEALRPYHSDELKNMPFKVEFEK